MLQSLAIWMDYSKDQMSVLLYLLVLFVGVGVLAVGMLVVVGSSSFGMFGFDVVVGFDDDDDDDDGPCAKNGARGINIIVDEVLVIPKT